MLLYIASYVATEEYSKERELLHIIYNNLV